MRFNNMLTLCVAAALLIITLVIVLPVIGNMTNWKVVEEPENVVVAPPGPEPGPKSTVEEDYNTTRQDYSPVIREVVVVHFKEMPASLDEYASEYGGKLIFLKEDIKFAAFEMSPRAELPRKVSQRTQDFMSMASGDARVEEARLDTFLFVDPNKVYTKEPRITYPSDLVKLGIKPGDITNHILVSFWVFPPSLEEFAQKHGGKLINFSDANKNLLYANFETDDIEGFLNSVSKDPYVRAAETDANTMVLF